MNLSLIIPCYNENDVLDLFYDEVTKVMKLYGKEYELIFVDDGSTDGTKQKIINMALSDNAVKYISFSRNFGKEAAMLAGMKFSKGEYIGILDADLQHPPEFIIKMSEALDSGDYEIAAARRRDRSGEARIKSYFSKKFYKVINRLADIEIKDGAQDFRIMKKKVVESILNMPEYHRFSKGIFSWVGYRTKWFEHQNVERPAGASKWNFRNLLKYGINGIISFSIIPLRISLVFGIIVSLIGFVQIFQLVLATLFFAGAEGVGTGFASIMSAILLVGGTILICLGITGEYVSRIYIEVKRRPIFIIDETNIL